MTTIWQTPTTTLFKAQWIFLPLDPNLGFLVFILSFVNSFRNQGMTLSLIKKIEISKLVEKLIEYGTILTEINIFFKIDKIIKKPRILISQQN